VFTKADHLSPSRDISPVHAPLYIFKVHFNTVFHLLLCLPRCFFLLSFPTRTTTQLFSPHTCCMPCHSIRGCSWDNPRTVNWKTLGGNSPCLVEVLSRNYPRWTEEGRPMTQLEFEPSFSRGGPKLHGISCTAARSLNGLGYLPNE
jgi:hypothetical protein